jgi:hypothetical protein
MKYVVTLMLMCMISFVVRAQKPENLDNGAFCMQDSLKQGVSQVTDRKVVVDTGMIRRFHEVKTEGDLYSWSQLLDSHEGNYVRELLISYQNADLGEESLQSIQAALESKKAEVVPDAVQIEDYIAEINRIKQEINLKLGTGNTMAMK